MKPQEHAKSAARRVIVAAGTGTYEHFSESWQRPKVNESVGLIAKCFEAIGYERHLVEVSENPSSEDLVKSLGEWVKAQNVNGTGMDGFVFYYCGHGQEDWGDYYLATRNTESELLDITAIEVKRLAKILLQGVRNSQILIILDACYSGLGANGIIERVARWARVDNIFVITTVGEIQEADPAAFATALSEILLTPNQSSVTIEYLEPGNLVEEVNGIFSTRFPTQTAELSVLKTKGQCRLFPNPNFDTQAIDGIDLETERRRKDFPEHWIPRARGAEFHAAGWYFSGRERALKEIVEWLGASNLEFRILVVTGSAGTGKSAILARMVTLSDPETRKSIEASSGLISIDPATVPPEAIISAAVHARGKTRDDVERTVADSFNLGNQTGAELIAALAKQPSRVIVIDALDEAKDPDAIAGLLREVAAQTQFKLLVATRPDVPANAVGQRVRKLGKAVQIIDLDNHAAYLGADDIPTYVLRRLLAADEPKIVTPYRDKPELARTVAAAVGKRANGIFLIAYIVSGGLINAKKSIDVGIKGWAEQLPGDIGVAFEDDLKRFDEERYKPLTRDTVKALLRPLAYAKGEGLPRERLWVRLANVMIDSETAFNDLDIDRVLEHAGAYIVRSTENGSSVFRLYHHALAEHLHDPERELELQHRIAQALIGLTPSLLSAGGKDWRPGHAHAYIRTHLASHAARTGLLDELVTDPLFLCCAEPNRLARALWDVTDDKARAWEEVYRLAVHRFTGLSEHERASYLHLTAYRQGRPDLAKRIEALPLLLPWHTVWARLSPQVLHQIVGWHNQDVTSVALGQVEGRFVIISGGLDGMVRRWDAISGEPIGEPLTGYHGPVTSTAIGVVNGRPMIVSGGGSLQRWDAISGKPIGEPLMGRSVAIGVVDGRPIIVSGSNSLQRWDAISGEPIGEPLMGHTNLIESVAIGVVNGRPMIVSGGRDKTVRRWDAISGEPIGGPLTGHFAPVTSVAIGVVEGRPMIVSAGGSLRRWDAISGELIGQWLKPHTSWSQAEAAVRVAIGIIEDHPIIVAGGFNGSIGCWDAISGEPIGEPLTGHKAEIGSVAIGVFKGRSVIVSGGQDGTVRRWDINWNQLVRSRQNGDSSDLGDISSIAAAVVDDRPVIVSGHGTLESWTGAVQRWDAISGKPIGEPLTVHLGPVTSVAIGVVEGRPMIVSGGEDRKVRRWDAASGEPIDGQLAAAPHHNGPINSIAIGLVEDTPTIVSGWWDGTIERWDAVSGRGVLAKEAEVRWRWKLSDPIDVGGRYPIRAIAIGSVEEQPVIVTGGDDDVLRCRHAVSGKLLGNTFASSQGPLCSLAFGVVDGRAMIISGGANGQVLCWDACSGDLVTGWRGAVSRNQPMDRAISSVAIGVFEGRPVIVSGAHNGTVLWRVGWGEETVWTAAFVDFQVKAVAILPNGRVAVAGGAGLMVLDLHLTS